MNNMQSMKVLIADDQDEFRTSLAEFINKHEGFEVIGQATNGDEAITLTKILSPDLILMDISMPRLNGIDAARQIKEFAPAMKIVFITIHEEHTYRALVKLLHVHGYVCKSSLKQELPTVLQQMKENESSIS